MQNAGLDLSCMQYGDDTGYTVTIIEDRRERTMLSFRGAAGEPLELTAALRQTLQTVRVLLLSGYLLADAAQARFAVEAAGMTRRAGWSRSTPPQISKMSRPIPCGRRSL